MEQEVGCALEAEQFKVQEVESLKQELVELRALAMKGTV